MMKQSTPATPRARLVAAERALVAAVAELEHEARRLRERLERAGGRSRVVESELKRIKDNLELNRRDLDRLRGKIAALGPEPGRNRRKKAPPKRGSKTDVIGGDRYQ